MEEVIKTNVGKVGTGSTSVDGEELMRGSQPCLDARVLPNPNFVLTSYVIGKDTNKSSFLKNPSQSGGDQSDVSTYGEVDGVSSWLIKDTTIETLLGVEFTSLTDIDVFTNSIKERKYADSLSMMSTTDINAVVNTIETIGKKFQVVSDSHVIRQDQAFPSDPIVRSVDIITKSTSYVGAASASTNEQPNVSSNFRPLVADLVFNGVNILIPRKVVKKVSTRFEHTLYGYFIGKRLVCPVVEYLARNNWGKHGVKRIMMNTQGFFFFKFDSKASFEAVLESGPWMIRKTPIILKKWSMSTSLQKE
nr:zinc knuckle CX2CX4HX4C [Tanacetum cinerariifolium]